jgi:hypothetical protein
MKTSTKTISNCRLPVLALLAVAALVFANPSSMRAQMMGRGPSMPGGLLNPTVGASSEYETTEEDGKKVSIEFAVVGKEPVNGKDGFWLEMSTGGSRGEMVTKTLIVPAGASTAPSRVIVQMGGGPAMEMPTQMLQRMGSAQPTADIRSSADLVGSESVTTPAGTFSCDHYRMKDGSGDTWVSSKVAPLGVVKHQGKGSSMILTKVTSDAKDKITGPVQPFNPQLMMQQHNPN